MGGLVPMFPDSDLANSLSVTRTCPKACTNLSSSPVYLTALVFPSWAFLLEAGGGLSKKHFSWAPYNEVWWPLVVKAHPPSRKAAWCLGTVGMDVCVIWGDNEREKVLKHVCQMRLHFHLSLSCIGEGNGNPLRCSCLENPRDGGAWRAAISGVAQSQTRLKRLSSSSAHSLFAIFPWAS